MLTLSQDTRSHQTLKTLNTTNQTPLQIGARSPRCSNHAVVRAHHPICNSKHVALNHAHIMAHRIIGIYSTLE
jgi:hypothetical protein